MELGYSQSDASERSGLHHTYIGQVERGEKNATINSVEKICSALDLSLEELFANIVEPSSKLRPAQQCYDLIISQPVKDQQMIYSLIENIIKYKNN
jgi:transcriptional regulator with XRE-family HTH domain